MPSRIPAQNPGRRKPEDTSAGCRAHAALDLERAAATEADRMRRRMEDSAASWIARAELLERLEASSRERVAASRAAQEKLAARAGTGEQ